MLPKEFKWLEAIHDLPKMVVEALKLFGIEEITGSGNNPLIMAWAREVLNAGVNIAGYSGDDVPWCGLFMALVALRAGKTPPHSPLWALNWRGFGHGVETAALGDVLVFHRPNGGHVGLYVAHDRTAYHVLGGNEHDSVAIVPILKSRCVAIRRPDYKIQPASVVPVFIKPTGAVSFNEQ